MSSRPLPPVVRGGLGVALAGWLTVLAIVLLAPSAEGPIRLVDAVSRTAAGIGVPAVLVVPERVEFLLNVAAFVPATLLGRLVWMQTSWRDWTAAGFVASFVVELVQALAFDGRSATHADVVANTLGGLVGAALGALTLVCLHRGPSERGADLPHR